MLLSSQPWPEHCFAHPPLLSPLSCLWPPLFYPQPPLLPQGYKPLFGHLFLVSTDFASILLLSFPVLASVGFLAGGLHYTSVFLVDLTPCWTWLLIPNNLYEL